jgi:hypothetical protein
MGIILINRTSTIATKQAAIIAKTSPASKVGRPHWNGYGTFILNINNSSCEFICYGKKWIKWFKVSIVDQSSPRSSTNEPSTINTRAKLCVWMLIIICTSHSQNCWHMPIQLQWQTELQTDCIWCSLISSCEEQTAILFIV